MTIWTVGHSTRAGEEFVALLSSHGIEHLIDIRTVPRSRRNPQFNRESLPALLDAGGIAYTHMQGLGGLRHPRPNSTNTAWRNDSFRGYADYMESGEFDRNLQGLMQLAAERRLSIMCAEAVPWRCHRSLVSDALMVRGVDVRHILSPSSVKPHSLTPFAHVEGELVTYPGLPVPTVS